MEYELNDVGPCRRKMRFTFTVEEIDAAFAESYQDINNQVQLRGFRKGKAPLRALEKRFGEEAAAGVRRLLVDKHLGATIREKKLHLLGGVVDKSPNAVPAPGRDFAIETEFDVAPDFDLPDYKGLELTPRPVEVAEEEVEKTMQRYRRMFANYEPLDGPAAADDILTVDFQVKVDGESVVSMQEQRVRVEGGILFDLPCPDLVEKLTGAKAGDTVHLSLSMPDDHPLESIRGKPAQVELAVKKVERGEMPELTDSFAETLGMGSIAGFRERVKSGLVRDALVEAMNGQEEEIVERLLGQVSFEVPAEMVRSETEALVEQLRMHLVNRKTAEEECKRQAEEYRPEAEKKASRKVRWGVLATKIAEAENITVSQEDIASHVDALARSYRVTPAQMLQRIRQIGGFEALMDTIISMKVVKLIADNAKNAVTLPEQSGGETESANAAAAASVAE